VAISVLGAVFWHGLLERSGAAAESVSLLRAALLAAAAAMLILVWFDWRARRLSPALAEARLQALQARIRPHFLFNSINSVLSLMRSNPARAETALENLAELYRVLMADNRQLSSLGREMELARAYLDLESLRLGERLQVDWRADNAPMPRPCCRPWCCNRCSKTRSATASSRNRKAGASASTSSRAMRSSMSWCAILAMRNAEPTRQSHGAVQHP
jgi:hypothetical protein